MVRIYFAFFAGIIIAMLLQTLPTAPLGIYDFLFFTFTTMTPILAFYNSQLCIQALSTKNVILKSEPTKHQVILKCKNIITLAIYLYAASLSMWLIGRFLTEVSVPLLFAAETITHFIVQAYHIYSIYLAKKTVRLAKELEKTKFSKLTP